MPRKPRIEFGGAAYHIMSRGNRGQTVFLNDADRISFLRTLGETCDRTGWLVHSYVLLNNHYHLLIETPEPNLVAGMRWLQGTYTIRFNQRHGLVGHLFQGRYKAILVDHRHAGYFLQVSSYIHLNPVRAGFVDVRTGRLEDYPWSSYPYYIAPCSRRPTYLCVERVLGELNLSDTPQGRRKYRLYVQDYLRHFTEDDSRGHIEQHWEPIRRTWCFGSDEFKQEAAAAVQGTMAGVRRSSLSGPAVQAHDETVALSLLEQGLSALGLNKCDLQGLRKHDPRKQVLAFWIRSRTVVSNRWLSEHLHMGHESNVPKAVRSVRESTDHDQKRWLAMLEGIPKFKD